MPTPSKWTPVKDYFKGAYSLTFGSDLFVPKQDFLLFFSPECCFVLGTDQFPLTAVPTSWELPAMMCPGSPSSYVPHRHKMLQCCLVSGDHWPCHHGRMKQGKERMGQCPSRYSHTEQNIHQYLLYHHDFSRHFPIILFHLFRKPETRVFIQSSSTLLLSSLASHHSHCPSRKTIPLEELQQHPILSG